MGTMDEEEFMINCTNFKFFAEQVLVAVGEGVKASLSAYDYLLRLD